MKKSLISWLLLSAVALSLFGCGRESRSAGTWTDADGSAARPYLIYTAEDLNAVRGGVPGYEGWGLDKHYVLMRNIDLSGCASGEGWTPIGTSGAPFTGSLDGNGKVVSHLTINRSADYQGLFGSLGAGAVVKNIGLSSVNVDAGTGSNAGGLAGASNGTISTSYSAGTVSAGYETGGLVGWNNGSIGNSYATGSVSSSGSIAGGLAGDNYGTISTSCSAGTVSAGSYAGGLAGWNHSDARQCYRISDDAGLPLFGGGTGTAPDSARLTAAQGKQQSSFINWNFGNTWSIKQGVDFPRLQWESRGAGAWMNGDGSADRPYLIYTAEDLNAVRGEVSGYDGWGPDKHYVLMQDIDLSGYASGEGWIPIGTVAAPFTGSLDGNGKVVSHLTINRSADYQGLFGSLGAGAVVKNIGLSSVNVDAGTGSNAGGLAGASNGTISNSYSAGTVSADSSAGGLAGWNSGSIGNSYATGSVSSGGSYAGGLAGDNDGTISTSYSAGTVSAGSSAGGLAGRNNGNAQQCYWISDDAGLPLFSGGTGTAPDSARLTTAQGRQQASFINWDFGNTWRIEEAVGYPRLQWERGVSVWTDADGSADKPYLIYTAEDLNAVRGGVTGYEGWGPDKHYVLMQDIDLSGYVSGEGWVPIGTSGAPFTGSLDGNGKVVSHLTIDRPAYYQGLFGFIGGGAVVKNVGLPSVSVQADSSYYAGGLVGWNNGSIINSYATGTVSDYSGAGGLAGWNDGTISYSYTTGTVSGYYSDVGGLAGGNNGSISNSYSTGNVSVGTYYAGGLVGENSGTISNSSAMGTVSSSSTFYVGGLVGYNYSTISNSYATGTVSGFNGVGGLVGWNDGTIISSYATGTVSGYYWVGGLAGKNVSSISNSYATGNVSVVMYYAGGLVGENSGSISNSYATGTASGSNLSSEVGGLAGGNNASVTQCYWITGDAITPLFGGGGSGTGNAKLTDAQGKQQSSFINWDFTTIWTINEGVSYPELQWQM